MDSRQKIIIAILMLGTLMGSLDSTIVILAFPTISASLHADLLSTMWIILVYLLVVAIFTTQLGRLGDIFGRSRMFNCGFGIFTAGSLFCGISPGIGWLILSRGVQALGGALMQANSGAIVADAFPAEVRGAAFGYISLGWTSGAMLGIVLGGIITTWVGWEYIFFINIPIGVIATLLGLRYVRDTVRTDACLDLPGMALLGTSLLLFSYSGVDFAGQGLTPVNALLSLTGLAAIAIFVYYEKHAADPIIRFSIFEDRILRYSILAGFFIALGSLSVIFLITMYLQGIRGFDPLAASLLLIPGYVAGSLLSPLMGKLSDQYGTRVIATVGALILILATLVYLFLGTDSSLLIVLAGSAISGIGSAMFFPANNSAVMASAPQGAYGSISGIHRTVQNIGLLGSFILAITVASLSIPRQTAFEIFIGTANLAGDVSKAFLHGIDASLLASIGVMACAMILSWMQGHEVGGQTR
jgi:EmrB/QacA subfamily drug resistance transporter